MKTLSSINCNKPNSNLDTVVKALSPIEKMLHKTTVPLILLSYNVYSGVYIISLMPPGQ